MCLNLECWRTKALFNILCSLGNSIRVWYMRRSRDKLDCQMRTKIWQQTLSCRQFHHCFTGAFFVRKFVQSQTLSREKLLKRLLYKKGDHKMLMKLATVYNFTNVWLTALKLADPKSVKRYWWVDCLFALLGSLRIKAVPKHVCEIDPLSLSLLLLDYIQLLISLNGILRKQEEDNGKQRKLYERAGSCHQITSSQIKM